MKFKRLGDMLTATGVITKEQLEYALKKQKETKNRLGKELVEEEFITEEQLIETLKLQLGLDSIDLSKVTIPGSLSEFIPKKIANNYGLVPVKLEGDSLYVAMSDPLNFMALEDVKAVSKKRIVPLIATEDSIQRNIALLYGNESATKAIEDMKREIDDTLFGTVLIDSFVSNVIDSDEQSAPTVRLVNSLIEWAVSEHASDIHIEPDEKEVRVRMRIDGLLRHIMTVPKDLQASLLSRLKIMGGMDITERRIPQDGRSNARVKNSDIDLRMSTLPTIYGEKFVIRLLDKNTQLLDKTRIGLKERDLQKYMQLINKKNGGVVLIVGPTGSGKTSTLYTMIRELNTEESNLITLEDPVEYNISGINQVQINEKTGMTFSGGLRAILRQDPDIIAVGEVRDGETAKIAMRAAITGHLVLSTIHTNSAVSTLDRLLDIGVEPYLISSALNGVISQRLVRKICTHCREEYAPSSEDLNSIGLSPNEDYKFYRGAGCPHCFGTGYRGRIAVFEILVINKKLRNAISNGAKREEIADIIYMNKDFVSLADNCRKLVFEGITTVEEAKRITNTEDYDYEN
ncbi:GspE/PulE family protein [Anaerotignum sp.]|uniref:GspE/PulE family protein n=1 Tax=Anaerotignum sp. TaxID=2039241 RepID=UPI0027152BED|nr:type II/IV secretion system protein [Anaerotignum sp.]